MCDCEAVQRKRIQGLVCLHCKDNYCKSCCYVKEGDVSCSVCLKYEPSTDISGSPPETCGDGYFEQWQDQHATIIGVRIGQETPWDITSYVSTPESRSKLRGLTGVMMDLAVKSREEEADESWPACKCLTESVSPDDLKLCGGCGIRFCEQCVYSRDGLTACRICLSLEPDPSRIDVTGCELPPVNCGWYYWNRWCHMNCPDSSSESYNTSSSEESDSVSPI